jgi:hypothetical protein
VSAFVYAGDLQALHFCTGNPGGPGHNVVKARYISAAPPEKAFDLVVNNLRVGRAKFIPSRLADNRLLVENDPEYENRLRMVGTPELVRAWLAGDWDIVAGGMFDDVWRRDLHVISPFKIPASWTVYRALDWGSARPFSVGWWAVCDGTVSPGGRHYPRGTLIRIAEWYGCTAKPNEGLRMFASDVAKGIIEREKQMGLKVQPGPADSSIWDNTGTISVYTEMKKSGVDWKPANKSPGSRVNGWNLIRKMLAAATAERLEYPSIFVFNNCLKFIELFPVTQRDEKLADDVDTKSEDHIQDEMRYMVLSIQSHGRTARNVM